MTIKELKKKITRVILEDIYTTDKVVKLRYGK